MNPRVRGVVAASMLMISTVTLSSEAVAADLILYPVQTGLETIRFRTGIPTLNLEMPTGAVTITPLPLDHGHATFGIAIYNKGKSSLNFGIENISATINGKPIAVLSTEELQRRAKSRATWSAIGMAMLAGAAAAAASTAHSTQHSYGHVRTPHGTYSWAASYRDNSAGVLGASLAVGAGAVGIASIQNRLDYTLSSLSTEIVQTTTVDPDNSYGGEIVIEKPSNVKMPYDVTVTMRFNDTDYPFTFRLTEQGKDKPPAFVDRSNDKPQDGVIMPASSATTSPVITPVAAHPIPEQGKPALQPVAQPPVPGNTPPPAASSS